MSTLYLIRHGQASFMAADYDVLSDRGIEQSRHLGRHFAVTEEPLNAVYSGPRKRQLDTAHHMIEAAHEAGRAYPKAVVLDELDEYPAFEIMKQTLPRLVEEDPQVREAVADANAFKSQRVFQQVFEKVIARWAEGTLNAEGLESYASFCERVNRGLERVMESEGRGRTVAIVTSGGPISISLRTALGLSEATAMRMAWVVANASVTEYRWREKELTLTAFNGVPHLPKSLVTFR